jgi:hypothetical protein
MLQYIIANRPPEVAVYPVEVDAGRTLCGIRTFAWLYIDGDPSTGNDAFRRTRLCRGTALEKSLTINPKPPTVATIGFYPGESLTKGV